MRKLHINAVIALVGCLAYAGFPSEKGLISCIALSFVTPVAGYICLKCYETDEGPLL